MDTRFVQTLLMVIDCGSIAEAARRMNLTPSAVVQRVKALEDEIGQPLVQRSGHSMQPTAAGAAIAPQARRLLEVEGDLKAVASSDQEVGLLRIGAVNSALTGLVPDIMITLQKKRPGIDLYLLPGMSNDLYRSVNDGVLDAALMVQPHFAMPKTLHWTPLREEPILLITPNALPDTDPKKILRSESFIRYDRNHWGGRVVDQYLRQAKIQPREQSELDSLEAITVLVSRGLGVALIPDWLPPWPERTFVRRIILPNAPKRTIGLLSSRSSTREPLIRAFREEAIRLCQERGYTSSTAFDRTK
ncbi:LysR family transcriptional regulator [Agrobacterium tumefaciens]|uniref:LysR family transcriptional regulator n=1 Tax=Agrobacterium tumefaciens TaxID=358 RepID=UPI0012B6BE99|nr:LysR family transcriptional regulator [Agrobacterium tumefaciens]MQB07310.1 LysR family transcriptional regulator [Agrobacterium tumefaciens]